MNLASNYLLFSKDNRQRVTGALKVSETEVVAIIIRNRSQCSICGKVLAERDDIVVTTHFIGEQSDPLWRFSDSGMHRGCFLAWEHRADFVERFNMTAGHVVFGNGTRHRMEENGDIVADSVAPPSEAPR